LSFMDFYIFLSTNSSVLMKSFVMRRFKNLNNDLITFMSKI